jgi:L-2-hydroxyglutarate oxidase LhgO
VIEGDASRRATFGVVGGGIVGLAVAAAITQAHPRALVVVFEKEREVGRHQTGHNSGVAHSGLYYSPGSLKARLCREGITRLKEYCSARGIAYREIGKLVVARDAVEIGRLRELHRRGEANGVPGLEWLSPGRIHQLEPGIVGAAALFSPTTAIVDYPDVARALADDVRRAGGEVRTGAEVRGIVRLAGGVRVEAAHAGTVVDQLVVCAGLQSDRVAQLAGDPVYPQIVPFRGEYMRLKPEFRDRVRHLIYPVPDPGYPFLGVHVTPRVGGEVDIGPNAVLALSREGYRRRDVSAADVRDLAASAGMRRLAAAHWRAGVRELRGSLSRRAFVAQARGYLPWLRLEHVVPAPGGVRAQAVDEYGTLVDDFRLGGGDGVLTVRNAPSPAATASLAIARYVADHIGGALPR